MPNPLAANYRGEHTDEVLAKLGYSSDEVMAMKMWATYRRGMTTSGSKLQAVELRPSVPSTAVAEQAWELAATVFLPVADTIPERPAVLVALPGAGYSRRYFDIHEPGYSEAAYHNRLGTVVVTLDHLGVGESSIPPFEVTTLDVVAGANHAAVTSILDLLRNGTLAPGVGAIDPACVVGAGQSMGGHILAGMQAFHRTFDAVAMLGSSMVCTTMPRRPGQREVFIPDGASPEEAAALVTRETDWRFAFFWEDVPESLVETDIAGGHPVRQTAPIWGSTTWPGLATTLVLPGAVASEAARIDVPVLLGMGERDLCRRPLEELAAFSSATDMAVIVVPRMAHMHNFAGTRRLLWDRIDAFIAQVATRTSAS
jgi:alpha-beta hydrolase superfamily lysophospholipase